ncbi:hypothetical protein HG531_011592 [Fusarium graminearum]|nr:hypothetical protein HG531_011592 [Fusarium graminearum]
MDVVVDIGREIVVDDVSDVRDIQTSSGNSSSNQDGASTVTEELESTLTLTLSTVTVNGGSREVLVDEEGETVGVGVENVQKDGSLVNILDVLNLLSNVLRGGTDTTDGKEDIHAIGLIEHEVLDVLEGDATSLYEVHQSTGSSDKQITATLDLSELRANVGTTVNDTRSHPRTVGELAGLVKDLRHKLTGRGKNQRGGVSLALATKLTGGISGHGRRSVDESLREDREQETTSLSGTGLGTSHQITTAANDRDRVLLNGCRDLVVSELNVAAQVFVQRRCGELVNRLGNVCTGSLNRDVVVLLEVDTSVLLGRVLGSNTEKLALDTGVGRAGDVLSIAPLSITRSAGSGSATTTRVTVEVAATAVATTSTAPAASAVVVALALLPMPLGPGAAAGGPPFITGGPPAWGPAGGGPPRPRM